MSKQRQQQRAARTAEAGARAAASEARRRAASEHRARAERRRVLWSRVRLWQHTPQSRRQREQWGAIGTVVLLVLVVVYVWTRSLAATGGTALICVIAAPVLAMVVFNDRSRS